MISNPHTGLKQFTLRYQYSSSVLVPESELFETCVGIGMGVAQIRNPVPEQDFSTRFWVWNWYRFMAVYRGRGPPGSPLRGAPVLVPRRRGPAAEEQRRGPAAEEQRRGPAAEEQRRGPAAEEQRRGPAAEEQRRGPAAEEQRRGPAAEEQRRGPAAEEQRRGPAARQSWC